MHERPAARIFGSSTSAYLGIRTLYESAQPEESLIALGWLSGETADVPESSAPPSYSGNGVVWRLPVDGGELEQIRIDGVPKLNNDHVLDPDGEHIYLSAND